jgi:hypothetical protein
MEEEFSTTANNRALWLVSLTRLKQNHVEGGG